MYMLFFLDRIFAPDDTAIPDSGDVEAPGGPGRGCLTRVRTGHETSRVSSKTIEREVPAPRPHAMREELLLKAA